MWSDPDPNTLVNSPTWQSRAPSPPTMSSRLGMSDRQLPQAPLENFAGLTNLHFSVQIQASMEPLIAYRQGRGHQNAQTRLCYRPSDFNYEFPRFIDCPARSRDERRQPCCAHCGPTLNAPSETDLQRMENSQRCSGRSPRSKRPGPPDNRVILGIAKESRPL
jgi:hypothetical protein